MEIQYIFFCRTTVANENYHFIESKRPYQNCLRSKETIAYILIQYQKIGDYHSVILQLRKVFADTFSSPKFNLSGKMNPNFLQCSILMLFFANDWSYFDKWLFYKLFTKSVVCESLTGWLGWLLSSNLVLDSCRE